MNRCPHCKNDINVQVILFDKKKQVKLSIGAPRKTPIEKVIELHKKGMSYVKIAKEMGVSKGAIQYAMRSFRKSPAPSGKEG